MSIKDEDRSMRACCVDMSAGLHFRVQNCFEFCFIKKDLVNKPVVTGLNLNLGIFFLPFRAGLFKSSNEWD